MYPGVEVSRIGNYVGCGLCPESEVTKIWQEQKHVERGHGAGAAGPRSRGHPTAWGISHISAQRSTSNPLQLFGVESKCQPMYLGCLRHGVSSCEA